MSQYEDLRGLVTIRPLERDVVCDHEYSRFRAGWNQTVSELADELRLHGAVATVLEVALRERDIRQDGMPRADARVSSPAIVISFKATTVVGQPQLRYEVGRYGDWKDNVRAVALALRALRAVDRYGVTKRGEQYAGWKELVAGAAGDGNAARGRALIDAADGNVKRALALAHPDHGGDAEDFRDVIAARDEAS